ncbi:DUF2306 domain-containing protein [Amycolatopsis sp.]|uniref:DUF2306 domain-containing protein n=1 Tax=Amycolatopsis sp. TaxID=37632 RepID=UPI002D80B49D|nr:DUF2306 domain-containing protein [Amycolatopsis sp.]HET6705230.1 DUF2306 domain-containing protein [Amycolatopsis sp.]
MTQNLDRAGDSVRKLPSRGTLSWRRTVLNPWVLATLALVVFNAIYALPRYLSFDPGQSRIPPDPGFALHYPIVTVHAILGNIAMITLLLQVMPALRGRNRKVHKISGYVYLYAGVLPSALLGLALLPFSLAPTGAFGLFAMSVGWIVVTVIGFRKQSRHRYAEHRRWMYYSFALALGTSWGRVLGLVLPLFGVQIGVQIDIMLFLELSSWLWVLNVLVAQWAWERGVRKKARRGQPETLRAAA